MWEGKSLSIKDLQFGRPKPSSNEIRIKIPSSSFLCSSLSSLPLIFSILHQFLQVSIYFINFNTSTFSLYGSTLLTVKELRVTLLIMILQSISFLQKSPLKIITYNIKILSLGNSYTNPDDVFQRFFILKYISTSFQFVSCSSTSDVLL